MRRVRSCGSRTSGPNPAVHRRFGVIVDSEPIPLGVHFCRFRARFAVAASADTVWPLSFARVPEDAHLCMGERLGAGDVALPLKGI